MPHSDDRPTPEDAAKIFDAMDTVVRAPWTKEQRISLNEFQHSGAFHPFTCDGTNEDGCAEKLYAAEDGWHCPVHDEYEQDWAWPWMANGEWKYFHTQMITDFEHSAGTPFHAVDTGEEDA